MMDCYCDYDIPQVYRKRIPTARKRHRCYECGGAITIGEKYEYVASLCDGDFGTFKTCERCIDIRVWVKNNAPCFCWGHGNMIEDAREAIGDAWWRAPEETTGIRFGLLRRIAKRDRLNKARESA